MRTYGKLVRNDIPRRINEDGFEVTWRTIDGAKLQRELRRKLLEEVREVLDAKDRAELITEFADVEEVIRALAHNNKISFSAIARERRKRATERGDFSDCVFLEYTSEPARQKKGRQRKKEK